MKVHVKGGKTAVIGQHRIRPLSIQFCEAYWFCEIQRTKLLNCENNDIQNNKMKFIFYAMY